MGENEIVKVGQSTSLTPTSIESALELAKLMASAKLVPAHLRESPGDCLLVINQAMRWGLDPLSVAQATSVVQGKLCYEGKLIAAVLVATGAIRGRPEYTFSGSGDDRTITVSAMTNDGKVKTITGCVRDWKSNNRYWMSQPDDMLIYRGTRQWARRYAPEAMLGIVTPDEMLEENVRIPAGKKPPAPVEIVQEKQPVPQPTTPEVVLDAVEVEDPRTPEVVAMTTEFILQIEEAQSFAQLLEIRQDMKAKFSDAGVDVPQGLKDAWASRKATIGQS